MWNQTQTKPFAKGISPPFCWLTDSKLCKGLFSLSFSLLYINFSFCLFVFVFFLLPSFRVNNSCVFISMETNDVTSISVDFKTTNSCHSNGRPPPLTTFRFLFAVISFESNLFGELAPLLYILMIFFQCLLLSSTQRLRQVIRCHNCNTRHHLLYSNWQQYQCADNCCFMASYFSCIFLVPFREDKDAA